MTFRNLLNLPFARLELRREEGQTMAEYGVVLAVITIAAVAAFVALGDHIDDVIRAVIGRMPIG
jgi:Flp pilus assembly pilin Flp